MWDRPRVTSLPMPREDGGVVAPRGEGWSVFAPGGVRGWVVIMRPTRPPSVEMHSRSCIGYKSKGESDGKLCPGLSALVAFVNTMCDVPADFEYDRAYGPYSGMRHEDRLVSAFAYESDSVQG